MIDLTRYFIGPSEALEIQAAACFWCTVGEGRYVTRTASEVEFAGAITKFLPGPFNLSIAVFEDGSCKAVVNGREVAGSVSEQDGRLSVTVDGGSVVVFADEGGTQIEPALKGLPSQKVWIGAGS